MKKTIAIRSVIAAGVAAAAMVPVASAASSTTVTVQVQGKSKTLLATKSVTLGSGSVTRGGVAAGKCPADTAQGALNVATRGKWTGKWYASYNEYFITGILGDNETSKKYYWGLYVNGKAASKGACDVKLKAGDKIVFKVTKS
jgi:hypothetical protein